MSCADCDECTLDSHPETGPHCYHELHVTVHRPPGLTLDKFLGLCNYLQVRPLVMELVGHGGARYQDWFTGSSVHGPDSAATGELVRLGDRLESLGLSPIRVKVESAPWHYRAPQRHEEPSSGGDHGRLPGGAYWESHVSAWVEPHRIDDLGDVVRAIGGYLSVNLLREPREDGLVRVSATCRSRRNTRYAQESAVLMLRDIIRRAGHEAESKTRTEFTWLDRSYETGRLGGPPEF